MDILQPISKHPGFRANPSTLTVVGIGASAGGVEALELLFNAMPDETGMAFVVIQHLSPDFESLMPQILARKTSMPISSIENGTEILPNNVYVLPSGKVAEIEDGLLKTATLDRKKHPYPINFFFSKLADEFGQNAIGIILSGTGSDGVEGIQAIHNNHGLVISQSEDSCKFNGMPRAAIATGIVDAIVPISEIPATLEQFAEIAPPSNGTRQSVFTDSMNVERQIQHLLHCKFGLDFDKYKQGMVGRRVARRMVMEDQTDNRGYLKLLKTNSESLSSLYKDLLIGVTEFFRDAQAFSELQQSVLPELIDQVKDDSGQLRIWSAACATGEEAYSIAILVDELLSQRKLDLDVKIFATDVNPECIAFASKGVYPGDRVANVSKSRRRKYFTELDGSYRIIPRLRKQIVFATHNLLDDAPFTKLSLVCCRNFLIYLKPSAKKKALSLFNFALSDSGVLFLGPSETSSELESSFEMIVPAWQIYRKVRPIKFSSVGMGIGGKRKPKNDASPTEQQNHELLPIYDSLLDEFMPNAVLINNKNQILHLFGDSHEFIRMRSGRPSENLLDMLPAPFNVAVSSGLQRAKIENHVACYPGLKFELHGKPVQFKVTVKRLAKSAEERYLVTFEEDAVEVEANNDGLVVTNFDANEVIQNLEIELKETRESLHDTILRLKSTNEEMQSTNEELIASNEELQSTNEELHSVNEELYTVNAEHQRKITELTELTDDMDNLLDSLQVDTIFLDHDLRIRKFTLGIANSFHLMSQDIGRRFASFNHRLIFEDLVGKVQHVLLEKQPFEADVQDRDGNWFLMRILPYNAHGKIEGVLLTLIEISDIKQTEQKLCELSEIVRSSDDAIFRVSVDGEIRTWNRGGSEMFLHDSENVIGKKVNVLGLDKTSTVSETLAQRADGKKIEQLELRATRRNGDEFDVSATISPIYQANGSLDGASITLRDITAQKDARRQIQEQVRLRDHFLALLSHELRNPTAAIVNASAVLSRSDSEPEQRKHANDVIARHSMQLAKMMDDLLNVARVTHNKIKLDPQPVDLVSTVSQVVECIEARIAEKQQILKLELPNQPLYFKADQTRIIQAQTNLLVNACKYTPVGGQIVYSAGLVDDEIVIEVCDDGDGMSPELLNRIFDLFVQADQTLDRSAGGMGLGLPLVKMIVEAHGGSISAESKGLGHGSLFRLRLPYVAISPNALITKKSKDIPKELSEKTILLVEDNDGAREMLAGYLRLDGFKVVTACNGLDGIRKFKQCNPELCVVDIGLPDLNGFQFAAKVRQIKKEVLLIALTGYGQEADRVRAKQAGFDVHLVKPVEPEKVASEINSMIVLNEN